MAHTYALNFRQVKSVFVAREQQASFFGHLKSLMSSRVRALCPAQASVAAESVGGVPERPKGADCKSAGSAFGGSNPPPSTSLIQFDFAGVFNLNDQPGRLDRAIAAGM